MYASANRDLIKVLLLGEGVQTRHPKSQLPIKVILSAYCDKLVYIHRWNNNYNQESFDDVIFALQKLQMMGYKLRLFLNGTTKYIYLSDIVYEHF